MSAASERIYANIDRYLEGMRITRGTMPGTIYLFEGDYQTLIKAANTANRKLGVKEEVKKIPDYKGMPIVAVRKA